MTDKNRPAVLIIDDELPICRNCVKILSSLECDAEYALNGHDSLKMMEAKPFDIVITDLKMSRVGGMEVLRRIQEDYPETAVIVMTGYASISSAVEVMKMGAFDYLPKPFTPQELRSVVQQALNKREIHLQNTKLKQEDRPKAISHQLIGNSPQIRKVVKMVQKVAPTDSTVLIYGESGTGKEIIARAVHANSRRKDRVFFAVDCGTLSDNLLESELFGYAKGGFTGAHKDKEGIFKLADQGTVFLDEIGNADKEVQGKLLRFLESKEFLPVGSTELQKVDVRLIFATNRDLEYMVKKGLFREDFYYRIFVYPITLPTLKDRKMDILPIAYFFLKQFSEKMGKTIHGFDEKSGYRLVSFDWPGNVRQLKNTIERAVILCEEDQITLKDLPLFGDPGDVEALFDNIPETNEELIRVKKEIRRKAVHKVERNFILNALMKNDWNATKASRKVGLQRSNFQNLMKKYNISRPGDDPSEEDSHE
ncbi:MAG: sigma-54-dependent Fis family transcriptional regulator [Desulfobacteraceae bacterium]|nr:MAG: sigma-54-dependent Fis family transcriptional regulator [Desulfobacteraceae bacterium]